MKKAPVYICASISSIPDYTDRKDIDEMLEYNHAKYPDGMNKDQWMDRAKSTMNTIQSPFDVTAYAAVKFPPYNPQP